LIISLFFLRRFARYYKIDQHPNIGDQKKNDNGNQRLRF